MTAIRAWVRRGLSSGPDTEPTLEGHEMAWLTTHIVSEQPDGYRSDSPGDRLSKNDLAGTHLQHLSPSRSVDELRAWDIRWNTKSLNVTDIIWEPIMGYDAFRRIALTMLNYGEQFDELERPLGLLALAAAMGISDDTLYSFKQLCVPLQFDSPLAVQLIEDFVSEDDPMLETFSQIAGLMQVDNEVTHAANSFISVVERVMKILCNSDSIQWRKDGIPIPQYGQEDTGPVQSGDFDLSWQFTISTRRFSDECSRLKRISFGIQKPGEFSKSHDAADSNRWHFLSPRDSVAGLISLWKYVIARKQKAISTLNSGTFRPDYEGPREIAMNGVGRIVGTRRPYSEVYEEDTFEPSEWLGIAVDDSPLPDGAHNIRGETMTRGPDSISWFLGMFLSPMAE